MPRVPKDDRAKTEKEPARSIACAAAALRGDARRIARNTSIVLALARAGKRSDDLIPDLAQLDMASHALQLAIGDVQSLLGLLMAEQLTAKRRVG